MPKGKTKVEESGAGRPKGFGQVPLPKVVSAPAIKGTWVFAGYVPFRRGILEHVQKGKLNKTDFAVYSLLLLLADHETGIWWGSGKALCAYNFSRSTARNSLQRLESGGYIRLFAKPGVHSNYPILINKYGITSGQHKGALLDAKQTTNPDSPIYVGQHQGEHVGEQQGQHQGEHPAPSQEVRSKNKKGEEEKRGASRQIAKMVHLPFMYWSIHHGNLPKALRFTDKRKAKCRRLLEKNKMNTEDFLNDFGMAIAKAAETPFCRGENKDGWTATFDWMIANDTNYVKVLEGNYDDSGKRTGSKAKQRQDANIKAAQQAVRDIRGSDGGAGRGLREHPDTGASQNLLPGAGK